MTDNHDSWTPPPWEPPLAGTEAEQLIGALERLRATFRWKADGLDSTGLDTSIGRSTLTLGGLLKHLALVEDYYSTTKLRGEPVGEPWASLDFDASTDWDFESANNNSPDELYAFWDAAVARSRAAFDTEIAKDGLDQPVHVSGPDGQHPSLRRLVFDLVEEYGRHTGHADLIREAVDGRVGEDPPSDWRP